MKTNLTYILLLFTVLFSCKDIPVNVENLRCELLINPLGIDQKQPHLSWEITGTQRNIKQTGYHILVASSQKKLAANEGDLWDSGEIKSETSIQVAYGGRSLESRGHCFWKVKVITNIGTSAWSKPASWTMGLLNDGDWKAKWTGLDKAFEWDSPEAHYTRLSARYFRKEFETPKSVKEAKLYISGLGLYKLHINGSVVGEQELSPTPTDYTKSVKYNTFDVTSQIKRGTNAIGVVLGNGRFFTMRMRKNYYPPGVHWLYNIKHFGFPKMLLQLELKYSDGSTQTIVSDDSWKVTADGPIRANNEFDGEEYDANKEMQGWNSAGFDDSKWYAAEYTNAPEGKLEAQINNNIKVMDIVKPVSVKENKPGIYIMDMGQNMVGWLRIKVKGNKGDSVKLRFSETLKPDGSLYMDNIREAQVTDIYTLKGGSVEEWNPVFTYHGFRYVEITGYPGIPSIENFEGQVLYDDMKTTGWFETSDSTINQIYRNAYWGIRGNYRGMPTDCPQRDERMGWLGDRAAGSLGESFMFNCNNLYAKWLDDIEQAQRPNGSIPDVAPNYWDAYNNNMTWPAAYIIIANMLYNQFGNLEPIAKHYDSMKKWLDYMKDKYMVDYIMMRDTYGDWCLPPESPELIHSQDPTRITEGPLLGTAYYYYLAGLMERFAGLLEKQQDVAGFAAQATAVKDAFNNKFFNKETQQYSNNTVTANLISLCYGLVPSEYEKGVFQNIVTKTENDFNSHVSVGLIGIQWLMRGLSEHGRADLAFRIATNRDYPGWGYMIENGATTIWELWNGNTADPAMNSGNHVMLLGDFVTWCYEYLAGIQNDPSDIGFKKIVMRPYTVAGLQYAKSSYQSVHGMIKSEWHHTNGTFSWHITIPCNSTATVYIPTNDINSITESGKEVASVKGVTFIKQDDKYVVFSVASGSYKFNSK